jgi:hypothetical protein
MEIEFTLDREDYLSYWMHRWELSPEGRHPYLLWSFAYVVVWLLFVAASLLLALFLTGLYWVVEMAAADSPLDLHPFPRTAMWGIALVFLVLGSLVLVGAASTEGVGRTHHRRQLEKLLEQNLAAGTIRIPRNDRVCLHTEGFIEVNEYRSGDGGVTVAECRETVVPWNAVEGIDCLPKQIILCIGQSGSLIVPKRAFSDEAACSAFIEAVATLRRGAEKAAGPFLKSAPEHVHAIRTADGLWPPARDCFAREPQKDSPPKTAVL